MAIAQLGREEAVTYSRLDTHCSYSLIAAAEWGELRGAGARAIEITSRVLDLAGEMSASSGGA